MKVARLFAALAFVALAFTAGAESKLTYPETKTVDHVDVYHGTEVADPYRWLEDDVRQSEEVANWVAAQNKVTFGYLESLPGRDAIRAQLTKLWDYERVDTPAKKGGRYFFKKNDGLQNQDVLYVQDSLADAPRVLLDPNTWSKDGTIALSGYSASDDGRWLAYSIAESGSDWHAWKILEIETGKLLDEKIRWVKWSGADWTPDSRGFFYTRFPEPEEGATYQSLNTNAKIYYHRVGTPQSSDFLVFERPDHPDWGFSSEVTEDGRYLVVTTSKSTEDKYIVFYRDLSEPYAGFVRLVGDFDYDYSLLGSEGPVFYFKTDRDAPRSRIVAIDTRNPAPDAWKEIIPQSEATLVDASIIGNLFVAEYLEDAKSVVRIYRGDGTPVRTVDLGGVGRAGGFDGRSDDSETFYSFESFTVPPTIYRYDVVSGERKEIARSKVAFDADEYVVKQVFYESKDGTKVPMFIAHLKGVKLNGNNPTLLYGYGGFNISMRPSFSVTRLVWMQMGGVFAMANLRGGGEYGEEWHRAGTKLQKQNVFDDFIAAGEWLIENKYTSKAKLAIQGGSNGGLLVGAVLNQRPDLFGAALPAVGVMDMLRFHHFTAGRYWTEDYGSSDNADEFEALYKYSPYHNVKKGTKYPATLITTADTDDRVVPGHSFKYAAAIQAAQAGEAPVVIRIESRAGHGSGKPTSKKIELAADQWSFIAHHLGLKLPRRFGK